MAGKRDKPEELSLVAPLVRATMAKGEAASGGGVAGPGMSVADAVRQIGVTVQTYYRWRRLYVGMGREQLKRLKELETSRSDGRAASTKGFGVRSPT